MSSLEAAVAALRVARPDATAKQMHELLDRPEFSLSDVKKVASKLTKRGAVAQFRRRAEQSHPQRP